MGNNKPQAKYMRYMLNMLDGASDLFNAVLSNEGESTVGHVRTVFGQYSLPRNLPIELVVLAEIDP